MNDFPFNKLSTELALEVIRFAASPIYTQTPSPPQPRERSYYTDALNLCRVSYAFYRATMPHLLHTVILSDDTHVKCFVDALHIQQRHRRTSSRLSLDYQSYVRRFWMSECCGPLEDSPPEDIIQYDELFGLLRGADIGFNAVSIGLFYNVLGSAIPSPHHSMTDWLAQKRLTLCGSSFRWKPLTSTYEGQAFLATLSHLTLWVSYSYTHEDDEPSIVREWLKNIPFELMPNLTHFALSLPHHPGCSIRRMLVYKSGNGQPCAKTFEEWGPGLNPYEQGVIVPFYVNERAGEEDWEEAYVQGESDAIWEDVGPRL